MPKKTETDWNLPREDYPELPRLAYDDAFYSMLDRKIRNRYYGPADYDLYGKGSFGLSRLEVKFKLRRALAKAFPDFPVGFQEPENFFDSHLEDDLEELTADLLAAGILFMNCTSATIARYFRHEITLAAFRKLSNR
jgi:hypothetical protein